MSSTVGDNTVAETMEEFELKCGHIMLGNLGMKIANSMCQVDCAMVPSCGHSCVRKCHYSEPNQHECKLRCRRIRPCGHRCPVDEIHCMDSCPPCEEIIMTENPVCGHSCNRKCHRNDIPPPCQLTCDKVYPCGHKCVRWCEDHVICEGVLEECPPCEKLVDGKNVLVCGHEVHARVPCGSSGLTLEPVKGVTCKNECGVVLLCGHLCRAPCAMCFVRSHHDRCSEPCNRIFACGHPCSRPCPQNCNYCEMDCRNECEHGKCERKCGQPCALCQAPCDYECPHLKCSRQCWEPCDRPGCSYPCDKLLPCDDPCMGFCGEPCPPLCRICHGYDLGKIILRNVTTADRFIFLPCGHIALAQSLECDVFHEKPKCPECQKEISLRRRFSAVKQLFSSEERGDKGLNMGVLNCLKDCVLYLVAAHKIGCDSANNFVNLKNYIEGKLLKRFVSRTEFLVFQSLSEAESLVFLSWVYQNLVSKACRLEEVEVPEVYASEYLKRSTNLAAILMSRNFPLYEQEVVDSIWEMKRLEDLYILILLRRRSQNPEVLRILSDDSLNHAFVQTMELIIEPGRYNEENHLKVLRGFREIAVATDCIFNLSERSKPPDLTCYKI